MRNIKLLALTFITALSTSIGAQKTYTFDDGVALATDWTVADNTSSVGGTAKCEIVTSGKFSAKNGNYLQFSFENKSGISISITSTASYSNISNITFDAVANDNSKPNFTLDIVDDSGNVVKNIYSNKTSKTDFNTGGTNKWGVSNSDISPVVTGHIKLTLTASSSGKYAAIDNVKITTSAPAGPVAVTGVTVSPTSTSVEAGQTTQLTATVAPSDADNTAVTWSTGDASIASVDENGLVTANGVGKTTITVTTQDGGFTATCEVTVTAPPAPIEVESISMKAATTIAIGSSETLTVTYNPADANTGKALTWKSDNEAVATVDANGKVTGVTAGKTTITATTANGKSASCEVTVQAVAVTGISLDKTSATIKIGSTTTLVATVTPADATNKNFTWTSSDATVASVNKGVVNGLKKGTATITVTTEDGGFKAECAVTVQEGDPVPETSLTLHTPGVYEEKSQNGGYNGTLSVFNSREYEVYYTEYTDGTKYPTFSTTLVAEGKTQGISGSTSETKNVGKPGDTWFEGTIASTSECKNASSKDEFTFETKMIREHRLGANDTYKFHVQGFDQFSLWGMDKKLDQKNGNQVFVVKVDGVEQPTDASLYNTSSYTIRRYNITTGRHLIEISTTCTSSNACYMGGISLRVAQAPTVKHLKGNDSTQVVRQTEAIRTVTYTVKYNKIDGAKTELQWIGAPGTGIELEEVASVAGSIVDTLRLRGTAMCPVGEYNYAIVSSLNGIETSRVTGKLRVKTDIIATSELTAVVYQNEEMDKKITFKYYALSADDVQLKWLDGQPAGITASGKDGIYSIGGTPTVVDTFRYTITIPGADTTYSGAIIVNPLDYGENPVLYLYKNKDAYNKDYVYKYLKEKNWNLIPRIGAEKLRDLDQYKKYKWIVISEDADANNGEVLSIALGNVNLPVLNMKGFVYAYQRNDANPSGWGEPDNGSLTQDGCFITVQRDDHPIFKSLYKKAGDKIQVLDSVSRKGLMPINIFQQGTLCLATALTRNDTSYYGNGELQTVLHEIPAAMRGGSKYICLPLAISSSKNLTSDGYKLLDAVVTYLLGNEPTINVPTVQITSFVLDGVAGDINQTEKTITLTIDTLKHPKLNLKEAKPIVTLASNYTFVTPASKESVDLSTSAYLPVQYVVTDYINRTVYNVIVQITSYEGIEEVYAVGDWVNVYDIFGRKITTTNENIYTMTLPRGVYIIVTESGQTLKITK